MLHVNSLYCNLCIKKQLRRSVHRKRIGKHSWRTPLSLKTDKEESNSTKNELYNR